jgi:hypothetical protein
MELNGINLTPIEEVIHTQKNIKSFNELMNAIKDFSPKTLSEIIDNNKIYLPLTTEELLDFIEYKGLYIDVHPEFYIPGVNWCWQICWYLPKENWDDIPHKELRSYHFIDGTFGYGDNGDYKTMNNALYSAIEMSFRLIENGFKKQNND